MTPLAGCVGVHADKVRSPRVSDPRNRDTARLTFPSDVRKRPTSERAFAGVAGRQPHSGSRCAGERIRTAGAVCVGDLAGLFQTGTVGRARTPTASICPACRRNCSKPSLPPANRSSSCSAGGRRLQSAGLGRRSPPSSGPSRAASRSGPRWPTSSPAPANRPAASAALGAEERRRRPYYYSTTVLKSAGTACDRLPHFGSRYPSAMVSGCTGRVRMYSGLRVATRRVDIEAGRQHQCPTCRVRNAGAPGCRRAGQRLCGTCATCSRRSLRPVKRTVEGLRARRTANRANLSRRMD